MRGRYVYGWYELGEDCRSWQQVGTKVDLSYCSPMRLAPPLLGLSSVASQAAHIQSFQGTHAEDEPFHHVPTLLCLALKPRRCPCLNDLSHI